MAVPSVFIDSVGRGRGGAAGVDLGLQVDPDLRGVDEIGHVHTLVFIRGAVDLGPPITRPQLGW